MTTPNAITVRGANKRYGDFVALDNIDFDVPEGSLTALLGPSGSGKSTLLRAIAGLDQPDTGTVTIKGEDVTRVPPQRRGIGFVFQHYAAFKHLTVRENVAFGLKIRKRPKDEIKDKVDNLLEIVGLAGFQTRYPNQLSGGQRQRMALARALAVDPQVLLLDEPFGALDAKVREDLRAWLRRLHDEVHVTTVLVTHDQAEALDVADRIAVLNKGRIEQVGSPTEVYDSPANGFVMSFLGAVSSLNGILVRPHDIRVGRNPDMALAQADGSVSATGVIRAAIDRIVVLGFEVRVELTSAADNSSFTAQITRGDAEALGLKEGDTVYVRATRVPPIPGDLELPTGAESINSAGRVSAPREAVDVFRHVQRQEEVRPRGVTGAEFRAELPKRSCRRRDQRVVVLHRDHDQHAISTGIADGIGRVVVGDFAVPELVSDEGVGDLVGEGRVRVVLPEQVVRDLARRLTVRGLAEQSERAAVPGEQVQHHAVRFEGGLVRRLLAGVGHRELAAL